MVCGDGQVIGAVDGEEAEPGGRGCFEAERRNPWAVAGCLRKFVRRAGESVGVGVTGRGGGGGGSGGDDTRDGDRAVVVVTITSELIGCCDMWPGCVRTAAERFQVDEALDGTSGQDNPGLDLLPAQSGACV